MCGKKKEIERYIIIPNNNMQPTKKLISDKVIEKDKINHDQIFRKRKMLQKSKRQRKESNNRKRNDREKNFLDCFAQLSIANYRLSINDYQLSNSSYFSTNKSVLLDYKINVSKFENIVILTNNMLLFMLSSIIH